MRLIGAFALVASFTATGSQTAAWDVHRPDANAATLARLFDEVCIANLGQSQRMEAAVQKLRLGLDTRFAGNTEWGPTWSFAFGQVTASDHRHHHDGDECMIEIREPAAPSAAAVIAALRERGLVKDRGEPAEFGATMFRRGVTEIFVRRDVAEETTGAERVSAGLTLLIKRSPG